MDAHIRLPRAQACEWKPHYDRELVKIPSDLMNKYLLSCPCSESCRPKKSAEPACNQAVEGRQYITVKGCQTRFGRDTGIVLNAGHQAASPSHYGVPTGPGCLKHVCILSNKTIQRDISPGCAEVSEDHGSFN